MTRDVRPSSPPLPAAPVDLLAFRLGDSRHPWLLVEDVATTLDVPLPALLCRLVAEIDHDPTQSRFIAYAASRLAIAAAGARASRPAARRAARRRHANAASR